MIVSIARFELSIDETLVSNAAYQVLQPFQCANVPSYTSFRCTRLSEMPKALRHSQFRNGNHYYEDENSLVIANRHSVCRLRRQEHMMEILPLQQADSPGYDLFVDLKFLLSELAIDHGGILFHSAGVVVDGSGFLFTGPSGAGKTTLSRHLSPCATIVNDEINILLPVNDSYGIYTSPFGSDDLSLRIPFEVAVKKIYTLKKSLESSVTSVTNKDAMMSLMSGVCLFPSTDGTSQKMFDAVIGITQSLPVECLMFSRSGTAEHLITIIKGSTCPPIN